MNEVTDEQRAAVEWLHATLKNRMLKEFAETLLAALPDALTNPQYALPTEKGTTIYGGRDQPRTMFRIANGDRRWVDEDGECYTDDEARELMGEWDEHLPIQERPQVTREQIRPLFNDFFGNHKSEYDLVTELLALVNGTRS